MAVPVPIDIKFSRFSGSFSAQSPNLFKTLANSTASLMSGSMDIGLLIGVLGGPEPPKDVGPWVNQGEWWFWDPGLGRYAPTQQGAPVGTIAIWGAKNRRPPLNWVVCSGQSVAKTQLPLLYQAIGTTWGSTGPGFFNLPPSGRFYVSAAA